MPRFSRDRDDNRPPRRPFPQSGRPGPQQRPPARRPSGPAAPAGPARVEPVKPTTGKQRRHLAKAAAWRLAKLLHVRPAEVLSTKDLQPMLQRALPRLAQNGSVGQAARLAAKVLRLRRIAS